MTEYFNNLILLLYEYKFADDRAALDAHRAQIAGRSSLGEFDLGGILSGNVHGSDEHFGSGGAAQSSNSERRSKAAVGADTATVGLYFIYFNSIV